MKKFFERIWPILSISPGQEGKENYQEYMTKGVLVFMWGGILAFTPIVLIVMFAGQSFSPFPVSDIVIVVVLNVFVWSAFFFIRKGHWQVFGHLAPLVLIFVGDYGIWFHGIRTSFLLFYAIVSSLAGMFHTIKHQILVNAFMISNIVGIVWIRGDSWEDTVTSLVIAVALLISISLLQNLSGSLMWRIISYNQALTIELRQEILLRKEREVQIAQMNEALGDQVRERTFQLADKHKELAGLSYTLAHDLRAPLRAMIGFNQIIEHDNQENLDQEGLDLLHRSIEAGRRMDRLIDSILSLSQIGESQMEYQSFCITEVVQDVFDKIQASRPLGDIELVIHSCPDVNADRELVVILLKNLMMNAVKYVEDQKRPRIEFGCQNTWGEKPIYYLKDNGIGFSMDYAEKIFEPFQRLNEKEDPEGLGIGLPIAKRVVERHGGVIWAESEVGEGTVFYFSL